VENNLNLEALRNTFALKSNALSTEFWW
jgi:hypothetical protein